MAIQKVRLKVSPEMLRDLGGLSKKIRSGARRALFEMAVGLGRAISREMPEDTRALRRSIRVTTGSESGRAVAEVRALFYGRFQHEGFGGKGKFPPPGVLEGWVRRKLKVKSPKEIKRVAFLVGRKLARIGGPGRGAKIPNRFVDRAVAKEGAKLKADFFDKLSKLK